MGVFKALRFFGYGARPGKTRAAEPPVDLPHSAKPPSQENNRAGGNKKRRQAAGSKLGGAGDGADPQQP